MGACCISPQELQAPPAENGHSPTFMSARITGFLFFIVLAVVFGLGAFLVIAADEMPAPGLILMGVSIALLIARLTRRAGRRNQVDSNGAFEGSERARDSYQYDVERRQRGEFDANPPGSGSPDRFD